MSSRARHPHDLYHLPTLAALLAKSAERADYRGSRLTAEQKAKAQQRGGISPAEWEGEIEAAKAIKEQKNGGGRHNRRGVADLPVATAKDLAEAAPRYCRFVDCRKELPAEAHFNARYCRPGDCQDRDEKRREAEVYGKRRGEKRRSTKRSVR